MGARQSTTTGSESGAEDGPVDADVGETAARYMLPVDMRTLSAKMPVVPDANTGSFNFNWKASDARGIVATLHDRDARDLLDVGNMLSDERIRATQTMFGTTNGNPCYHVIDLLTNAAQVLHGYAAGHEFRCACIVYNLNFACRERGIDPAKVRITDAALELLSRYAVLYTRLTCNPYPLVQRPGNTLEHQWLLRVYVQSLVVVPIKQRLNLLFYLLQVCVTTVHKQVRRKGEHVNYQYVRSRIGDQVESRFSAFLEQLLGHAE